MLLDADGGEDLICENAEQESVLLDADGGEDLICENAGQESPSRSSSSEN